MANEKDRVTVAHSGELQLDLPPEQALHLFTAPGETLWVPGWEPTILSGDGTEEGTVFLTGKGEEKTIWVVVDFDAETFRARYARVAPTSRAGTVEICLHPNGEAGSTVMVTYRLTALSDSGNSTLTAFDAMAFQEMLKEWKALIAAADIDLEKQLSET